MPPAEPVCEPRIFSHSVCLPTLDETALFMISSASLNFSLMEGWASTWSENMDFHPRYHLVISS